MSGLSNYLGVALVALSLFACGDARAEGGTCPPGYYPHNVPGVMGCAPIPGYVENRQPEPPESEGPARYLPPGSWVVVAVDREAERVGVSTMEQTKRAAKKLAKQRCGTKRCKVELVEYLGCGALARGQAGYSLAHSSILESAEEQALAQCTRGGDTCKLSWSECTPFSTALDPRLHGL